MYLQQNVDLDKDVYFNTCCCCDRMSYLLSASQCPVEKRRKRANKEQLGADLVFSRRVIWQDV